MEPMVVLGLIAFGLLFVQGLLSIMQYKMITNKYKEVRSKHSMVSVGRIKRIGRGCIAMMAFDEQGICTECQVLMGLTVFAGFRRRSKLEGMGISKLFQELSDRNTIENQAILQAVGFVRDKFQGDQRTHLEEDSSKQFLEPMGSA